MLHRIKRFICSQLTKKNILFSKLKDDNQLYSILKKEHLRQINSLELITSENFTSTAVL